MFKKLIQYRQGGFMQTRIHLPFFLILFTIFSVSFSVSSATGQALGQTFETYQPPDIARKAAGAWTAVDSNGNAIKRGNPPRVNWEVCTSDVCGPESKTPFGNIPGRARTSWKYVFANTQQVGLPGTDAIYNFETGIWTTTAGQFKDGVSIGDSIGITPPTPTPGVPPVINGSYMQQMAEVKAMSKEIDDLYRAGKQDEGEKKQMEQQIKKENAIVGEMIRLYGNNLSTELKNFALNIDASFKSYQRETELTKLLFKERKRLGEPPVGPPGVTPPDGPPSDDPVEAAKQARDLAQQNVTTSKTELDTAKTKEQEAEQKLATAKTKLEEAIAALRKAEQDAAELLARKIKEEEERLAALKKAREEAEAKRLAFEKAQREERERIAKAIRDAENARLAAIEKVRKDAEDAAKKAAEEAEKIAAEEAAQQAKELKLAENKATDAKSVRQAAEDALKEALEAAESGDSTAKLKAQEAQQKADAAKLEFEKQAEAAQKEAKEKARLAAEAAAKQEAEVAAAVAAMQKIEAAQKAAQDLARQAKEHAAKIREAWGLPTTSAESGSATPVPVAPIKEKTMVSPGGGRADVDLEKFRIEAEEAEAAALKAAAEQAATESQ